LLVSELAVSAITEQHRGCGTADELCVLVEIGTRKGEDAVSNEEQLLTEAIDQFQSQQADGVISVNRVTNPLLTLWQLATDIDHSVAVPIEALLTALAGRQITTARELTQAMDATRAALASLVTIAV
jgi:hypothetical protein